MAVAFCDLAGAADLNGHLLVAIGTISYTFSEIFRPESMLPLLMPVLPLVHLEKNGQVIAPQDRT